MPEPAFDPQMKVALTKDGATFRFEIYVSTKITAWPFWIADERGQRFGFIESPEKVLALKAKLQARVLELEAAGWIRS